MTSPFTSFQFSCPEDVFNEPIGNSYLPAGRHDVTVVSAEIAEGSYGLELILNFEDDLGKKAKKNFSLIAKDNPAKPGIFPHFMYILFGQAAFFDVILRTKLMMSALPSNTALAADLKGVKINIEIVPPKKGYTIIDIDGRKAITDCKTGEFLSEQTFETFDEAKAHAKAVGLKQAYTNVDKFYAINDTARLTNDVIGNAMLASLAAASTLPKKRTASV